MKRGCRWFMPCLLALSCGVDGGGKDTTCDEMIARVAECLPAMDPSARCGAYSAEAWEELGLASRSCEEIGSIGQQSSALFKCGEGEHTCALVFCCDDYRVTWWPGESDWGFLDLVLKYQAETPSSQITKLKKATKTKLRQGFATTFTQKVKLGASGTKELAVEITSLVIDVPYKQFTAVLPAADWGVNLAYYLGGEVFVYEKDQAGRPVRQLERMVLSPIPCSIESTLTNQDMTKVEKIVYKDDAAIVYWRVMYSDNGSTEEDLGRVEFRKYDSLSTQVIFHSAHRLKAAGAVTIPNSIVTKILGSFFLGHLRHYRQIVESAF